MTVLTYLPAAPPVRAEEVKVPFDWDFFPFMGFLTEAVGGARAVGLLLSVVLLIIAAVAWGLSRAAGASKMQTVSGVGFLVCVVVAIGIGAGPGIISWASGLKTGF